MNPPLVMARVVDPLFGFGGSKLLSLLPLQSPGEDWLLSPGTDRLFVSMPAVGKVAIADTQRWTMQDAVATGPNPRQLRAAGGAIWVADDEGLTRIAAKDFTTTRVRIGKAYDLAASQRDLIKTRRRRILTVLMVLAAGAFGAAVYYKSMPWLLTGLFFTSLVVLYVTALAQMKQRRLQRLKVTHVAERPTEWEEPQVKVIAR